MNTELAQLKSIRNAAISSLVLLILFTGMIQPRPVLAVSPITVTKVTDTNDGFCDTDCSLREALVAASNGDIIDFEPGLSGTTLFLVSTLVVTKNVTIDGSSLASPIIISGDTDQNGTGDIRIFEIDDLANVTLNNLTITKSGNVSFGGGGILNYGTLTVTNSNISYNSASGNGGGGILNWGGSLILTDSVISNSLTGGGLVNYNGTASITNGVFTNNTVAFLGGGILNHGTLTITDSVFDTNTSINGSGGGIYINSGTVTITKSEFTGNTAKTHGGGIYNLGNLIVDESAFSNNSAQNGGGINSTSSGTLTVKNSTFTGNTVSGDGGGLFSQSSGAIIANNTFHDNTASSEGGGLFVASALTLKNNTFSDNTAASGGGIAIFSLLNFYNNIIANSTSGGDCYKSIVGTINANVKNLVEDGACSAPLSGDPKLAAFTNNGGSTQTMALQMGSPAIDQGSDSACASSPVNNLDQRGVARPIGTHCDIGSFESPYDSKTFASVNVSDGWILESGENTNAGGSLNASATTLLIGDNAQDKQYRSILSFNTSSLPDNATITKATLKIKRSSVTGGGNPVSAFQGFMIDVRKGTFGLTALEVTDWQAAASKVLGPLSPPLIGGFFTIDLTNSKAQINKFATGSGITQIRLRFQLGDDDNGAANYIGIFSGNAGASSQPQLIVEFYIP